MTDITKLRVGESVEVKAEAKDAQGLPAFIYPLTWHPASGTEAVVTVAGEAGSLSATVTGVAPGSDEVALDYSDAFSVEGEKQQPVGVIGATRLEVRYSLPSLDQVGRSDQLEFRVSGFVLPTSTLTVVAHDARTDPTGEPNYTSELTDIEWHSDHQRVGFPDEVTAAGTLSVTCKPLAFGDDTIRVSAKNGQGVTIYGTLAVRVLGQPVVTVRA